MNSLQLRFCYDHFLLQGSFKMKQFLTPFFLFCFSMLTIPWAMSQSVSNQYYEIIEYQGIEVARLGELDAFLEKALIPSLNRMGIENVGALSTEIPVEGKHNCLNLPITTIDPRPPAIHFWNGL